MNHTEWCGKKGLSICLIDDCGACEASWAAAMQQAKDCKDCQHEPYTAKHSYLPQVKNRQCENCFRCTILEDNWEEKKVLTKTEESKK